MLTAALFLTAKRWKQPKHPSTEGETKGLWYIHITEYYSVIKRNEVLSPATTWMKFENTVLSERSQTPRTQTVWFHLQEVSRNGTTMKAESRLVVAKGSMGGKERKGSSQWAPCLFWRWQKCSGMFCSGYAQVVAARHSEYTKKHCIVLYNGSNSEFLVPSFISIKNQIITGEKSHWREWTCISGKSFLIHNLHRCHVFKKPLS